MLPVEQGWLLGEASQEIAMHSVSSLSGFLGIVAAASVSSLLLMSVLV